MGAGYRDHFRGAGGIDCELDRFLQIILDYWREFLTVAWFAPTGVSRYSGRSG